MYKYLKYLNYILNFIKYLPQGNKVLIKPDSKFDIPKSSTLRNVKIFVAPGARLDIGSNVCLNNTSICVEKGECIIQDNCIIGNPSNDNIISTNIIINNGSMEIGDHTKLSLNRIWIRFGGRLTIGSYTNINTGSEIRCDELVTIGAFSRISYGVKIWDTNTHTILNKEERRAITKKYFPYFGYETTKPKTSPVIIGNDCWIGEKASLLKGTKLGNEVIVGYNCLLTGQEIPDKSTAVSQAILKVKTR